MNLYYFTDVKIDLKIKTVLSKDVLEILMSQ